MDPGEAVYDQKALYVGFNVTQMLRYTAADRPNAIGALLGNSKWGYLDIYTNRTALGDQSGDSSRAFRLLLIIHFADGSAQVFTSTAAGWSYRHGPIVYDHLWHGEIYDTRQETPDHAWNEAPLAAYRSGTWLAARLMHPTVGPLFPQLMPPIRITQSYAPARVNLSTTMCAAPVLGGTAVEGGAVYMSCVGGVGTIDDVQFAAYGTPSIGPFLDCSGMRTGQCNAGNTLAVVRKMCVGKSACVVDASTDLFGNDPCPNVLKSLAIRARGSNDCVPAEPPAAAHTNTTVLFDFGQNMAGFTTLTLDPPSGEAAWLMLAPVTVMLRLKHTEITNAQGMAYNNYFPGMEFDHSPTCSMSDWFVLSPPALLMMSPLHLSCYGLPQPNSWDYDPTAPSPCPALCSTPCATYSSLLCLFWSVSPPSSTLQVRTQVVRVCQPNRRLCVPASAD